MGEHAPAEAQPRVFHGQVALVTGASSGIGAATARTLAARGAVVAVNYHRGETMAKEVVESIETAGGRALALQADVTDRDQVKDLVERAQTELGPVEILVTNATGLYGFDVKVAPFIGTSVEYTEWIVQRQLRAVLNPIDLILPGMIDRGHGSIVAVGAALSRTPAPGFLPLSMAKASVEAAVKVLAQEAGPYGVRVNGVGPGLIITRVAEGLPEQVLRANAQRASVRRNGLPQDVAEVIAFLAADPAGYLTGSYLLIDGGTALV
ncbi:SDR family NAD(P)-dependent oxidoreductase [Actinomadura alba]|uniref:SDR family oxidoreductase n=1 Tax=Actinomadura alba TaxID=406431 RepID=A0ABR7LU45_9ACTN|nr:SDR family oxidoreductase [Actinomadura alba]MBC6468368.1 SDR family oxidoreductase [Actinomadura alba]